MKELQKDTFGGYAKDFTIVTDSSGDLQRALGADLPPRCFIVNSNGKVVISQMVIGNADGFIKGHQAKARP